MVSTTSRWFELALYLVVAAFLVEPWFAGRGAALTNSVAMAFVALSVGFGKAGAWWALLLAASVLCLALVLIQFALSEDEGGRRQRTSSFLRSFTAVVASWRCLVVGALFLSLVTFNRPFGAPWVVSASVVLYCLLTTALWPHRSLAALRQLFRREELEPRVVEVGLPFEVVVANAQGFAGGDAVVLSRGEISTTGLVTGLTTFELTAACRISVPGIRSVLPTELHAESLASIRVQKVDGPVAEPLEGVRAEVAGGGGSLLGTIAVGSKIREALVELEPGTPIEFGELAWSNTPGGRTFWQVSEATIRQLSGPGDNRNSVVASLMQIGRWDEERFGFVPDLAGPVPSVPVVRSVDEAMGGVAAPAGLAVLGRVSGSTFPVAADIRELSRHHVAVLGTTGTGKTHFAFSLVVAFSNSGSKVLCVDGTGQYLNRFVPDHGISVTWDSLDAFLASDARIGVYSPTPEVHTVIEANRVARKVNAWAADQGTLGVLQAARCVIVFEEAQNFVPEGFVIDGWDLKAKAQDTSLIVLEARKFGLGFVLVSQRTAMVTKSALSQCNTVFAFQAVDQTGLDYLEGLCGLSLARGIPNLPHRTAVAMGRGLTSTAPLIMYVDDAPVVVA